MEDLSFNISINASPEKVWNTLFTDANYPKWTAAFCSGSHAITDWQEGSKALFLDDKGRGMHGILEKVIPNEYMRIKGVGEVKDGQEVYDNEGIQACSGIESYKLTPNGNSTNLHIELSGADFPDEMLGFFNEVWPKALDAVKEIAEQ